MILQTGCMPTAESSVLDGWFRSPERRRARLFGWLAVSLVAIWVGLVAWMITLWGIYQGGDANAFIDLIVTF